MQGINFFIEDKRTHSNKAIFGLCDDANQEPAYIDENEAYKDSKWIGIVLNNSNKYVEFYPIDNCIELKRKNGDDAHKCEGFLFWKDNIENIVFTELKDRKKKTDWLKDAKDQIFETLSFFFCDSFPKYRAKAWICNRQLTNPNYYQQIEDFKNETYKEFRIRVILHIAREFIVK